MSFVKDRGGVWGCVGGGWSNKDVFNFKNYGSGFVK